MKYRRQNYYIIGLYAVSNTLVDVVIGKAGCSCSDPADKRSNAFTERHHSYKQNYYEFAYSICYT